MLFLSYGHADAQELADRLCADLEALGGYEVWQDTKGIRAGSDWWHEVQDALTRSQIVIALLSPIPSAGRAAQTAPTQPTASA